MHSVTQNGALMVNTMVFIAGHHIKQQFHIFSILVPDTDVCDDG